MLKISKLTKEERKIITEMQKKYSIKKKQERISNFVQDFKKIFEIARKLNKDDDEIAIKNVEFNIKENIVKIEVMGIEHWEDGASFTVLILKLDELMIFS